MSRPREIFFYMSRSRSRLVADDCCGAILIGVCNIIASILHSLTHCVDAIVYAQRVCQCDVHACGQYGAHVMHLVLC